MKTKLAMVAAAVTLVAGMAIAAGFNPPVGAWSYNTAGEYIFTNSAAAGRSALSMAAMSPIGAVTMGQTNSIWVTLGSSTNWHEVASSTTATNTLMFLDGSGAIPLEVGGKIRFRWSNTNAIVRLDIVTRSSP